MDRCGRKFCKQDCSFYTGEFGTRACKAGVVGTIRDDSTACYKIQSSYNKIRKPNDENRIKAVC